MKMKKTLVAALSVVAVVIAGCPLGTFIVNGLVALGEAPVTEVRIAGSNFITLDTKANGTDSFSSANGYLCVVHHPGCGIVGNQGTDVYFGDQKPLPLLVQTVQTNYTAIGPSAGGGIGGWGSYGTNLQVGSGDGTVPTTVSWNNACQGVYAGKDLYYRMSFVVRVRGNVAQLNEQTFDPSATPTAPCGDSPAGGGGGGGPPMPSGWLGVAKYCNVGTQQANGTLVIKATLNSALSGATGSSTMSESIPIGFAPSGSLPSSTNFMTKQMYKQGTWTITSAQIQGLTGPLPGQPLNNVQLPGGPGTPVLDFSGGNCGPI